MRLKFETKTLPGDGVLSPKIRTLGRHGEHESSRNKASEIEIRTAKAMPDMVAQTIAKTPVGRNDDIIVRPKGDE